MVSAEQARARLVRGNEQYQTSGAFSGRVDADLRQELASGQHPFVIVVSCSDSRVLPEAIFSCGLGEIFSIRVAGNVIGDHVLGSIQYAYEHLGCRLAVILGHTNCGAVHSALTGGADGYTGSLIRPICEVARGIADERVISVANARAGAKAVTEALDAPGLTVCPALYDIESGAVEWL